MHQDAAFYPHSNDDVLAVGLLLDDGTAENGAMSVLPGSHRGPIHTHFDAQGRFVGACATRTWRGWIGAARSCSTLPAGSIHIHHYRLVHWSAPNTSPGDRRLLINAYSAADAVPLAADPTGSPLYCRLVRGPYPAVARRTAGDMPMPPDFTKGYTSIYELQGETAPRPDVGDAQDAGAGLPRRRAPAIAATARSVRAGGAGTGTGGRGVVDRARLDVRSRHAGHVQRAQDADDDAVERAQIRIEGRDADGVEARSPAGGQAAPEVRESGPWPPRRSTATTAAPSPPPTPS